MLADPTHRAFEALRAEIAKIEAGGRVGKGVLPFGVAELDGRLPDGGLQLGALHEVAGGGTGAVDGAASALFAAGLAARTLGQILWCVTRTDLFAPALFQAGLAPERVIFLKAGDDKTVLACCEEALRHGASGPWWPRSHACRRPPLGACRGLRLIDLLPKLSCGKPIGCGSTDMVVFPWVETLGKAKAAENPPELPFNRREPGATI
jgi:hypothetical protein